jgi:hypothetical protein
MTPEELRAARVERLRTALAREQGNLQGALTALERSERPPTPMYAEFIRDKAAQVESLMAQLELEGG